MRSEWELLCQYLFKPKTTQTSPCLSNEIWHFHLNELLVLLLASEYEIILS